MTSTENRRRLRNFLLDKPVQYRYGLYFFLVSVMAAVVSQVLMLRSAETLVLGTLSAGGVDPSIVESFGAAPLRLLGLLTLVLLPALALVSVVLAIFLTHRFLGPQVAIKRHVEELLDGNYESVCRLRKHDELSEIAAGLNRLAAAMRDGVVARPEPEQRAA